MRIDFRSALSAVMTGSTAVLLSGCWDPAPYDFLINESGVPIVIHAGTTAKPMSLPDRAGRALGDGRSMGLSVVIEARGCRYVYELDREAFVQAWLDAHGRRAHDAKLLRDIALYSVTVWVEPDFTVQVVPKVRPILTAEGAAVTSRDMMIRLAPRERQCP